MLLSRKLICGMLVLSCLVFGGCEKVKELTEEEEEIITLYAAKVVAKHNVRLGQGIMRYRGAKEDEAESGAEDVGEDSSNSAQNPEEETDAASQETSESASAQTNTTNNTSDVSDETREVSGPKGLAKALGLSDVKFLYKGARVPESLRLSSYYTLQDPAPGNQYVVVSYQLQNPTTVNRDVSVAALRPKFKASLNGQEKTAGVVLEKDLSTYEGTLTPGAAEDLILLFEFPAEATKDLSGLGLTVDVNGTTSRLKTRVR